MGDDLAEKAKKLLAVAGSDPTGYIGRLTAEEQQTLDKFRGMVLPVCAASLPKLFHLSLSLLLNPPPPPLPLLSLLVHALSSPPSCKKEPHGDILRLAFPTSTPASHPIFPALPSAGESPFPFCLFA